MPSRGAFFGRIDDPSFQKKKRVPDPRINLTEAIDRAGINLITHLFGIAVPALMCISRDVALIMVKTLKVGAAP